MDDKDFIMEKMDLKESLSKNNQNKDNLINSEIIYCLKMLENALLNAVAQHDVIMRTRLELLYERVIDELNNSENLNDIFKLIGKENDIFNYIIDNREKKYIKVKK